MKYTRGNVSNPETLLEAGKVTFGGLSYGSVKCLPSEHEDPSSNNELGGGHPSPQHQERVETGGSQKLAAGQHSQTDEP